jgi:hypothetical protein
MKTVGANRDAALKDIRRTVAAIRDARNRMEIYRACELLSSQALWLRDLVAHTITRRGAAYPDHDWEFYQQILQEAYPDFEEQHGRPA